MNEKYTYKYVRIKLEGVFFSGKFDEDYQGAVDGNAKEGWRFVQAFASAVAGYGASKFMDLIFEKQVT